MSELTLAKRLRAVKKWITAGHGAVSLCDEAADEIDKLRAALEVANANTASARRDERTNLDERDRQIERLQLELETQRDITDREYDSKCGWINEAARLRAALTEIAALPPYSRALTAAQACVIARNALGPADEDKS